MPRLLHLLTGLLALCLARVALAQPGIAAPEVPARAWILVDYDSGRVLAAHAAEQRVPPASLTKLAVAYVLFQRLRDGSLKLSDRVIVGARAAATKGASMFLRAGQDVSVEQLLKGMIVISANDATVALAEQVAGSEAAFVAQMNTAMQSLGLGGTNFVTTNGLPASGHHSTARDMARLATALLRDFPEHYDWFAIKEFSYNGIRQYNRNALLWRDGSADGIKTGHTREAGFCLIASARRAGMRLIAVALGAADENARVTAAQQLLDFGFRHFETRQLYAARTALAEVRVWMGDTGALSLGPAQALYLTLPRGWHERVQARLTVKQNQMAPIRAGQPVGMLVLELDRDPIAEYPLVALEAVAQGNVFQRALDRVQLWFE